RAAAGQDIVAAEVLHLLPAGLPPPWLALVGSSAVPAWQVSSCQSSRWTGSVRWSVPTRTNVSKTFRGPGACPGPPPPVRRRRAGGGGAGCGAGGDGGGGGGGGWRVLLHLHLNVGRRCYRGSGRHFRGRPCGGRNLGILSLPRWESFERRAQLGSVGVSGSCAI